tara:strand:- start:384 stop:608 length:225 start_codon:yes stop_codon:yes gene_type:complete
MNKLECDKLVSIFLKNILNKESCKEDFLVNSDDLSSQIPFYNKYQEKEKEYKNFYDKNKMFLEYCSQKYFYYTK